MAGRTVIVTGGSRGIGRAIAQAFVEDGDQVALIGRDEQALREAAEELGDRVAWQVADVSRREQVEAAVARVVNRSGPVAVLVNNAGFVRGVTTDMEPAEAERLWDEVLNANLKGAFLMALAVAPRMVRPGGRIIQVSSIAAFTGGSRAGSTAYAAAKAGLHGLTAGLARELSSQGITVNAVAPGFI
ncbi:MAG: SDR family NAD(P)-dependent oxidoreductase, partial [Bacillota bacterium]